MLGFAFTRKDIFGCIAPITRLMERYSLRTPWGHLNLHVFYRSDEGRELHDHPWAYHTLILWGGYWEVLPLDPRAFSDEYTNDEHWRNERHVWRKPGSFLHRPAQWLHRVELAERAVWKHGDFPTRSTPQIAITLLWTSRKTREWGFRMPDGTWMPWKQYHVAAGCAE